MIEDPDECCVCLEPTDNQIQPCEHLVCKECILRWCEHKMRCPLCKAPLLAPCGVSLFSHQTEEYVLFEVPPKQYVGITLANDGARVVVRGVDAGLLASSHGIRRGYGITHINDLPVRTHQAAISVVELAQLHAHPLRFTFDARTSHQIRARGENERVDCMNRVHVCCRWLHATE